MVIAQTVRAYMFVGELCTIHYRLMKDLSYYVSILHSGLLR